MRPLTEEESKALFTKLANYIASLALWDVSACWPINLQGKNLVHLIDRPDEPHCFRLHRDRVYYVSESSMRLGISVARPNLVSLGTCFGKFSKNGKFKLHITALDYLAQYAKYKVRIPRISFCTDRWEHYRCGSNQTERCLSYTEIMSWRLTWGG